MMREATAQERLEALRRVREEQARRASPAEEAEARRRRRLTARLHDAFRIRTTRRGRSPGSGAAAEEEDPAARHAGHAGHAVPQYLPPPHTPDGRGAASSVDTIPEAPLPEEGEASAGPAESPALESTVEEAAPVGDNPAPERFAAGR
jgi:hypothetical protein